MRTFYSSFINQEREKVGLTLNELSRKSGVPFSTLQKITAQGSIPRIDTLEKILDALDYEVVFWPRNPEEKS